MTKNCDLWVPMCLQAWKINNVLPGFRWGTCLWGRNLLVPAATGLLPTVFCLLSFSVKLTKNLLSSYCFRSKQQSFDILGRVRSATISSNSLVDCSPVASLRCRVLVCAEIRKYFFWPTPLFVAVAYPLKQQPLCVTESSGEVLEALLDVFREICKVFARIFKGSAGNLREIYVESNRFSVNLRADRVCEVGECRNTFPVSGSSVLEPLAFWRWVKKLRLFWGSVGRNVVRLTLICLKTLKDQAMCWMMTLTLVLKDLISLRVCV